MTTVLEKEMTLERLTTEIKIKMVENKVLANTFNRNINQNTVEIGQRLIQAKNFLLHGEFSAWLAENFKMTDRTARNYMKVAAYFGVNSTFKSENVFRFQPSALIELTKLKPCEVESFLEEQEGAGVNVAEMSTRQLQEKIREYKNTVTEEPVKDLVLTAPSSQSLVLSKPQFQQLPTQLNNASKLAQIPVVLNFGAAKLPIEGILITRFNFSAVQKFSPVADCYIYTKLNFVRSDDVVKILKVALWYFGNDVKNFAMHFGKFGKILQTEKSPYSLPETLIC